MRLAKAFFCQLTVVSHWYVPSPATVKLVTCTFDMLKQDPTIGRAEALRSAEMAMLDPANPPEFAHPMAWAVRSCQRGGRRTMTGCLQGLLI
jgi:hypothetical protein